jgi:hypothetical protein
MTNYAPAVRAPQRHIYLMLYLLKQSRAFWCFAGDVQCFINLLHVRLHTTLQ